ncbi:MAG: amidohydrolase family protein [Candidatus Korobacteraceae bacterium]|jgi:predicted TIM-barrel fold metal-dependent hydrolase
MKNNGCTRREFTLAVPLLAVGVASLAKGESVPVAQAVKWSSGTELPRLKVPPNAADCHHHIYDSRFPADPTTHLRPGDALISDYRMLQKRLGTTRNVIVQPSTYGVDNRLLVESLHTFGMKTTRGVAVVNSSVSDMELKQLHEAGVRGVRFNLAQGGGTTWEMVTPLAKRFAEIGWHIQMNAPGEDVLAYKALLSQLPCPLVFDHLARLPLPAGSQHPAFGFIVDLMQKQKAWVKLSGAYILSKDGPPHYADSSAIAKAFVKEAPERLVWGSDWPHPTAPVNEKPDDAILLDLLSEWAPNEAIRNRILVDNPAKLYQF